MKKLILLSVIIGLLSSCLDNNDNYYANTEVDIATVENPDSSTRFYLRLDNNIKLYCSVSDIAYYRPKNGQRIIANYRILTNKSDTSSYQHDIQLIEVYEVLTKKVLDIKPEQQDSIGNDVISIRYMWIGSDYLNVEFNYPGNNKVHFINLVWDISKSYDDGKMHYEFRHNANNDEPVRSNWGMASFDLSYLKMTNFVDSINIVVHTKEFTKDGTYELTYKPNPLMWFSPKKVTLMKSSDAIE